MSKSDGKRASVLPPIEGDFPQWPFSPVDNKFLEQLGVSDLTAASQPSELQQKSPHTPHELTSLPNEIITELGPLPLEFKEVGPKENPSNLLLPASDRIADLEARIEDQQAEISRLKSKVQGLEEWAKKIGPIINGLNKNFQNEVVASQEMDKQLVALTGTVNKANQQLAAVTGVVNDMIHEKRGVVESRKVTEHSTNRNKRKAKSTPSPATKTTKRGKIQRIAANKEGQGSLKL